MKRNLIILGGICFVILIVVLLAGAYKFNYLSGKSGHDVDGNKTSNTDYKNLSYTIDGQAVQLVDGLSETEAAPGSASKVITKYFGNEVKKDLDGDGRDDIAFLLTQETGGSGTFFYVVAALNTKNGYKGSAAVLLGDRIAPQTTESGPGKSIIVNYMDRASGEPMTARPSVGKSLRLILDPMSMQFGEIAQNFEGEADPNRMTLGMKEWIWQKVLYNDGKEIVPKKVGTFTLTFSPDGKFSAKTDCNNTGGTYVAKDGTVTFTNMYSTAMYCEASQEADFSAILQQAQSYHFTSKGELVLDLKFDSGSAVFK